MAFDGAPSKQEGMKDNSKYLKGDILQELLDDSVIAVSDYSYELLKFHGTYQGYDRDTATERKKAKLDKLYEFMVRLRIPAGRLTAKQYAMVDDIAGKYANNTLRLTTRETFQMHCIVKGDLKPAIAAINEAQLSTLSACGDVVRNVMTTPSPVKNVQNQRLLEDAYAIASYCEPKTTSYDAIWNDAEETQVEEPLYGKYYLPRKFKIAVIAPDDNSVDVFTHDLGFVALFDGDTLTGYNVLVGGGLGMNHNKPSTYPRLATPIAFIGPDDLLNATDAVVQLQRDHGDRNDRKHARLKYVVEEKGVEWTKKTFLEYFNALKPAVAAQEAKPVQRYDIPDHMGWHAQGDGLWYVGVPVSSGRIIDTETQAIRTGLRHIIDTYGMNLVITADQNIILCDITDAQKAEIEALFAQYNIDTREQLTHMQRNLMACVALPTCGKALAEAERVKLPMEKDIHNTLAAYALEEERIAIRIAGCPNGCSRPYVGDIGIVGRTPGHYALFIGGDFEGTRLNEKIFDKVPEAEIGAALSPFFAAFKEARNDNKEGFGDFCHRVGIESLLEQAKTSLTDYKWAA